MLFDFSNDAAVITITNNTESAINLPIFPDNGPFVLNPADELKYKVRNSREYLYYYQTCKALGLSLAVAE